MSIRKRFAGISLGVFAGDLSALAAEVAESRSWGCDILHFDVMDGVFVPQLTGGPGFMKGLPPEPLRDVHLMVANPQRHIAGCVEAGADIVTVHAEATDPGAALDAIRQAGSEAGREILAGVSLMPGTPIDGCAAVFARDPDYVLVLALDPRDGSSPDIVAACGRLAALRERLPAAIVGFDGGVTHATLPAILAAAPDVVVSGSAVMQAGNRERAFQDMNAAFRMMRDGLAAKDNRKEREICDGRHR